MKNVRRLKSPGAGKRRFFITLLFLLTLGILLLFFINMRIRPLIASMATARVTNMATQAINDAVNEEVTNGNIEYDRLVFLEKDAEGKVTALKTNMAEVNRIKADITNKVLNQIQTRDTSDLSIPIGNIISNNLLSGRGPEIPIRIISVSSANATFENEFSSAGINQTRQRIILHVAVTIGILLPGYSASTVVESDVCVAETVIVGSVPGSYTYFENIQDAQEAADHYFNFK
ncbi:MAG: sporulation protein YunB [Oscillospiraceae bacterium]|jgi:sporulation protein YunB